MLAKLVLAGRFNHDGDEVAIKLSITRKAASARGANAKALTPAIFSTVIPAKAGIQGPRGEVPAARPWIPAFAGMTE